MTQNTVEGIDELGDEIDSSEIAVITKSVIYGKTAGGGYVALKASSSGALTGGSAGIASTANTTTTPLGDSATYTGAFEQNDNADVMVSCITDKAGTLYFDFSVDGTNVNTFPTAGFAVSAGIHEFHNAVKGPRYFRVRFVNGATGAQTYLRLYTYYGAFRQGNLPLNQSISSDADAITTRSVILGETTGGHYLNVPVDTNGHIEMAIHSPLLPFGSVHTESLTPIYQSDAVYQLTDQQQYWTSTLSGAATATSDGMFSVSTGTTIYAQALIQSRKRLRYRAGQGVSQKFTSLFTNVGGEGVENSYQLIGLGNSEDGLYFGYGNTNDLTDKRLGMLHVYGGKRAIKTLTISAGATSASNVTITLDGTAFTVAVTASSNIQRTVWEISQATYAGWKAVPSGATVIFIKDSAGVTAGTQTFGAGTTGATSSGFVQTRAGVASTDTFYPQDEWNGDKLDGTGPSGYTFHPDKLEICELTFGYLGTDATILKVKVPALDGNNSTWVIANSVNFPGTRTQPSFRNPSFPFTMVVYSAGSTTNLTVKCASYEGAIEGQKMLHGPRLSYYSQTTSVTDAAYKAMFTVLNKRTYAGQVNQAVVNLLSASGAIKHTQPVTGYLIKNGTLAGNPNFVDKSSASCCAWDTAATTVTWTDDIQIITTFQLGETGEFDHHFGNGSYNLEEVTLQPGEYITFAYRAVQNNPAWATASLNTREDQ